MVEAQTYLSKCISQKRSIYSNRTVSYVIVLLELLTVLLEYIDLIQNSQAVKKVCGPQKGYGEKRCEIQGGGQEMAVMVG